MVGFAMILGGAAKGYGEATLDKLKADALAKREEALSQANFERQRILAGEARQFQVQQDESQRAFTREENDKNRAADQAYRDRSTALEEQRIKLAQEQSGDIVQTETGPGLRRGTIVEPLTDKDGKPVKLAGTTKDKPADVATAEWLIQNNVAKDATDAFRLIKQGVKADVSPAEVEKMVETATKTELDGRFGVSPEEVQKIRDNNRQRIERNLGITKEAPAASPSTDQTFIDQSLENARQAIAAGKPRDAVIERLKAAGIDPAGL
jgi:multidrug efflux pump subunit AcrA (membrane-fusion protein)